MHSGQKHRKSLLNLTLQNKIDFVIKSVSALKGFPSERLFKEDDNERKKERLIECISAQ